MRHRYLRPLLLLATALLAAACGGKAAERPAVVEAYGVKADGARLGDRLRVFIWPDYLDPALVETFEKTYGVRVTVDNYDNNEAMIAKLKAGGLGQYDVVVASDYAVEALSRDGLLETLDRANVPNLKNLAPRFRGMPFDPENRFSACYQWGTSGLAVRPQAGQNADAMATWKTVFDAAAAPGPFTMMDDPRETIGAALISLGHSINTTDAAQLAEAERLLVAQRPRVLTYASSTGGRDLLMSGDAVLAHVYSGDAVLARDERPDIRYVIPREGSILWTDNLAIPAKAPNKYLAEVFINFMLDAKNGAQLTNFTRYATPNAAAEPLIDPKIKGDPTIYPDSATLSRMQLLRDVGPARAAYDRIWTRLRAGGGS